MSDTERQILTPGESAPAPEAAPVRRKPGPKSAAEKAAAEAAAKPPTDDLAEFDSDKLPAAPAASAESFSPAQQALIAQMIAQAVQASKASQDPKTAAALAAAANTAVKHPTQIEAAAICNDQVVRGIRPRPVMTEDGWYVHPESVRTVDHGVAKLNVS